MKFNKYSSVQVEKYYKVTMTPKLFKDIENFIKTTYGSLLGKQLMEEALITGSISVERQGNLNHKKRRQR